jgi:hypothetical protein
MNLYSSQERMGRVSRGRRFTKVNLISSSLIDSLVSIQTASQTEGMNLGPEEEGWRETEDQKLTSAVKGRFGAV